MNKPLISAEEMYYFTSEDDRLGEREESLLSPFLKEYKEDFEECLKDYIRETLDNDYDYKISLTKDERDTFVNLILIKFKNGE